MNLQSRVSHSLAVAFALLSASITHADDHDAHFQPSVQAEPAAQLTAGAPLAIPLSKGLVVVPFHTEHVKIVPVYGEAAQRVVPRIGHLHITLDHATWHWLQASEEPIVIQGLSHGPHQLTLELADANHHVLAVKDLEFIIP